MWKSLLASYPSGGIEVFEREEAVGDGRPAGGRAGQPENASSHGKRHFRAGRLSPQPGGHLQPPLLAQTLQFRQRDTMRVSSSTSYFRLTRPTNNSKIIVCLYRERCD